MEDDDLLMTQEYNLDVLAEREKTAYTNYMSKLEEVVAQYKKENNLE